jgi:hypothetical protein
MPDTIKDVRFESGEWRARLLVSGREVYTRNPTVESESDFMAYCAEQVAEIETNIGQ